MFLGRGARGLAVSGLGKWVTTAAIKGFEWPPSLRKIVFSDVVLVIEDVPSGCELRPAKDTW